MTPKEHRDLAEEYLAKSEEALAEGWWDRANHFLAKAHVHALLSQETVKDTQIQRITTGGKSW